MSHMREALQRARDLLDAAYRFIEANNLEHKTVFYDEAECDGYCLMDDCKIAIEDADIALDKADGKPTRSPAPDQPATRQEP
jgi:hypothetical protein